MKLQELIGKRIKELRTSRGWSQMELAFRSNIDRTYMTDVENGKRNVSALNIEKIINGLDMSISDFFNSEIFKSK